MAQVYGNAMHAAPQQKAMSASALSIYVEDMVSVPFNPEQPEQMVHGNVSFAQYCKMMCCPLCCLFVPLQGGKNKLFYTRECGCCGCPYKVDLNDQYMGKVEHVGCCDNGCWFCCCASLTCSGHVKLLGLNDARNQERFVFLKELYPCWLCCGAVAVACQPICIVCVSMNGCYNYLTGSNIQSFTQPVFKGPWTRTSGAPPVKVGDFVITNRFLPISFCCAYPVPMKFYYRPVENSPPFDVTDVSLLSLILQLLRGMPGPARLCSTLGFHAPVGIPCMDWGLGSHVEWQSVQSSMKASE